MKKMLYWILLWGSGSTGVVCELLNRNFIGFELDEKYYSIATQRILEKK